MSRAVVLASLSRLDANCNGQIEKDVLVKVLSELGVSGSTLQVLLGEIDQNNGVINLRSFLTYVFNGEPRALDNFTSDLQSRFLRATGRRFIGLDDEREGRWTRDWNFVILADTQFGLLKAGCRPRVPERECRSMGRALSGAIKINLLSGEAWAEEKAMAALAVKHVNKLMPKFAIVCGDMVDAFPETGRPMDQGRGQDDDLHQAQIDDFKEVFDDLHPNIHLLCVCGNHDVGNVPNRKTIADYRREFGDDYFSFTAGGCRCLVLNTQLHNALEVSRWTDSAHRYMFATEKEKEEAIELALEQNAWLESECRALSEQPPPGHVFCFSHIPPFIRSPNEPKGYYNLEPNVRRPLLNKLKSVGCKKWFSGHYHQNAGGCDGCMEIVITGAAGIMIPLKSGISPDDEAALSPVGQDFANKRCDLDVSGLRLVTVTRNWVHHKWYSFAQLEKNL